MSETRLPLFEGLTGRQVEQALGAFDRLVVRHGTELMVEGDEDPSLLVVVEGELEVRTGELDLWTARPGELLGEIGLFAGGVRTATVETNTEATLLHLSREGYDELVQRGNPLAYVLERRALDALVRRLRSIDARIAKVAQGTPLAEVTPSRSWFSRVRSMFGAGERQAAPAVDVAAALERARLFAGASPAALARVAPAFVAERWNAGGLLCREGEVGDSMYVLVGGLIDVLIATDGERVEPVATLDPGDAFGMAGLVDRRPRSATCVARGPVTVLRLDRTAWSSTVDSDDTAGRALRLALLRSLAEQLAFANGQLALLDLNAQAADLTPLLLATAGVEAQGRGLGG